MTALAIILLMGVVSWKLKIMKMNKKTALISEFNYSEEIKIAVNFEDFNFGLYLLIGFLIGGVLSILIVKSKREGLTT